MVSPSTTKGGKRSTAARSTNNSQPKLPAPEVPVLTCQAFFISLFPTQSLDLSSISFRPQTVASHNPGSFPMPLPPSPGTEYTVPSALSTNRISAWPPPRTLRRNARRCRRRMRKVINAVERIPPARRAIMTDWYVVAAEPLLISDIVHANRCGTDKIYDGFPLKR